MPFGGLQHLFWVILRGGLAKLKGLTGFMFVEVSKQLSKESSLTLLPAMDKISPDSTVVLMRPPSAESTCLFDSPLVTWENRWSSCSSFSRSLLSHPLRLLFPLPGALFFAALPSHLASLPFILPLSRRLL